MRPLCPLLALGATYYQVTAIAADGTESAPSVEVSATPADGNQSVTLSFNPVPGAVSYKIYRSTIPEVYRSTIAGVYGNNLLAQGTLTVDPNTGMVTYTDDGTVSLTAGVPPQPATVCTISVPVSSVLPGSKTMPYGAVDLLQLSQVSLNSGTMTNVTSVNALHVVAYLGDADGDGLYTQNDAELIMRVALGADSGFAAYPLVDPVIVADVECFGFIGADAASQVVAAALGLVPSSFPNPPLPFGTLMVF